MKCDISFLSAARAWRFVSSRHAIARATSALLLAAVASPVFAQGQEDETDTADDRTVPVIIVTAQKREQQADDVPMSITAVTGDRLATAGVQDVRDLVKITPAFNATDSILGTPVYTLRGVGFSDISLGGRPTVSVYLDEVPIPFAIETRGATLDLERVEILKGPQGTLFGQNSTGGAINYIAAKPTSTFEAGVNASYGNFDAFDFSGYLSGPITDTMGARLAIDYTSMDDWQRSYTSRATNGSIDFLNGRFMLDWVPNDTFSATLTLGGYQDKSDKLAGQAIAIAPSVPPAAPLVTGLLDYPLSPARSRAADFTAGEDYARDNWFTYANLRLDAQLNDSLALTSLTSVSEYNEDRLVDTDGTALRNLDVATTGDIESFSQELRLSGDIGGIGDFVIGFNYTDDEVDETEVLRNPESTVAFTFIPFGLPLFTSTRDISAQQSESLAFFGNVNVEVSPEVRLYGGLRYTDTSIEYTGCSADVGDGNTALSFTVLLSVIRGSIGLPPITPIAPGGCFTADATLTPVEVQNKLDEDNVSWRGGFEWTPNEDLLFYANVSKGYKSGSFPILAASSASQLVPVTQESLLAYEAGFKTRLIDGTMQFNGAVFHYDYSDKQILGQVLDPIFGNLLRLVNIPDSRITGAELDIVWVPADGLTITAGGSYIDSEIQGDFVNFDSTGALRNFDGESFPNTPEFQFVSDVDYRFDINDRFGAFVGGSLTHQSSTNSQLGELPNLDITDRTLLDLRAGIESANGDWQVSIWGRNVTDEYYWESANTSLDTIVRYAGLPATYGVSVSFKLQ